MKYDTRFALIDTDGDYRYPDLINGTYQVGKEREALPTNIAVFARAILVDRKSGRFACKDGRKPGVVGYGKRAIVGYDLHPDIADMIGVPASGFVGK